jgi:hypothetical protein
MKDLTEAASPPGTASLAALKHPCPPGGSKGYAAPTILFSNQQTSPRLADTSTTITPLSEPRNGKSDERRRSVEAVNNGQSLAAKSGDRGSVAEMGSDPVVIGVDEEEEDSLGALIKRSSDETNGGSSGRTETLGKYRNHSCKW